MRLGTLLAAVTLSAPALVAFALPAEAATTYSVTGLGDPSPTPACAGLVCPSLRAAVAAAHDIPGSTIELAAGTYELTGEPLQLGGFVTVEGAGAGSTTIRQTADSGIIDIWSSYSLIAIRDLTLTGGHAVSTSTAPAITHDGAIYNAGDLSLTRVVVTGNSSLGSSTFDPTSGAGATGGYAWAGAIFSNGSLTLTSSTVSNNLAQGAPGQAGDPAGRGGAAAGTIMVEGTLTIVDSTFADNVAQGGAGGASTTPDGTAGVGGGALGGVVLASGDATHVTISGSTFARNKALGGAGSSTGGTHGAGGDVTGGAIVSDGANLVIVNSTFADNEAVGGTGGSGAPDGVATGGAIAVRALPQWTGTTTVASTTFSANSVAGSAASQGGNLVLESAATTTITDSIITGGTSSGSSPSCQIGPGATIGGGHNLEDTSPSQCGLSETRGDLIGQDPVLGALADHGGPTGTLLPAASSPVIGAGGECTDPSADPATPLAVDQRGEPRPSGRPCDIGSVQLPVPLNTTLPSVTPTSPVGGKPATCNPGTFVGSPTLTYDYAWTRDGAPVGQPTATYPVPTADIGHTLRCTVVAHGSGYSSPPATSAARTVIPPTPVLTQLTQTHTTWRIPSGRSGPVPMGTRFSFTLSEPATATLVFTRVVDGRYIRTGKVVRTRRTGSNVIGFTGRLDTGSYLRPGHYIVAVSAKNAWGKVSRTSKLHFTLVS